jgi:ParB-like chromosome segregation protein Spo0J
MVKLIEQAYEVVSIDAIKPHPRNVNEGNLAAIGDSMRTNGFYGALRVQRSTGYIVAGNHSWAAAEEIGLTAVPVIFLDIDDDAALRVMLSDNQTARESHNREQELAELLTEISHTSAALSGTGFASEDLDKLLAGLANGILSGEDSPAGEPPTEAPEGQAEVEVGAQDQSGNVQREFQVLVKCQNALHQTELLDKLTVEGYQCRAASMPTRNTASS